MGNMRWTALILAMVMFLSVAPWQVNAVDNGLEGYTLAASSESLELYYNAGKVSLAVKDRKTGMLWKSSPDEDIFPSSGLTDALRDEINSLLLISYAEMNLNSVDVKTEPVMSLKPDITITPIDGGVQFVFNVRKLNLSITLNALLDEDALIVSVPFEQIEEGVGSDAAVRTKLEPIKSYIKFASETVDKLKNDKNIADARKYAVKLSKELENLKKQVDKITDAVGIVTDSDAVLKSLSSIQTLYAGGAGMEGLFTKIWDMKKLDDNKKQEYMAVMKSLDDNILPAKVAASALKTIKVGSIIELYVMPYFGAGADSEKGYVLYPDGSGAISRFKPVHPTLTTFYKRDVYSDDDINIDWEHERDNAGIKRTMLPVFGINKDEGGFVAAIANGDANSAVSFCPSGYIFNLNRVYASFRYRRVIEGERVGTFSGGSPPMMYEKTKFHVNAEIRYMFLNGENADYSGMANRYRRYLLDNGKIRRSQELRDEMPLGLDVLGGIKQRRIIFEHFIKMTSFGDTKNMLESLRSEGIGSILLNIHGWTESGFGKYPSNSRPARQLGGNRGLVDLAEYAKSAGIRLYLQDNYVETYLGMKGYRNNELALNNSRRIVKSLDSKIRLASPLSVLRHFIEDALPFLMSYKISGISFESIGTSVYYDYARGHVTQRADSIKLWQNMLEASSNKLGHAAVRGGNGYVLGNADWLLEIPIGVTGYLFTDEEVPFYQMVIHGLIPYTSKPFNQFYDNRLEKLKAVEYGCIPYYILTWEDTLKLKNTEYNTLFSTKYEDWESKIVPIYKEFNTKLSKTVGQFMIKHEILENGVVYVKYSNGVQILINYSDQDAGFDGYKVKAMDYTVID